jgi:hypothetical protein
VLTGVLDEEYRSRAYAQGVEMFWQKPNSAEDIKIFQDCIESMLNRAHHPQEGFRGVQSKSLVDLIQLECLSRSSSVLHITRGALDGKIWVQHGEITDATTGTLSGEEAFREILSWRGGNFEILPADLVRERKIHNSSQALLLDSVQAMDEAKIHAPDAIAGAPAAEPGGSPNGLAALGRFEGVSFVLTVPPDQKAELASWSLENATGVATWARDAHARLAKIGEMLHAGEFTGAAGFGVVEKWGLKRHEQKGLLFAGFRPALEAEQVEQTINLMFDKWAS